ncbi:cache domain-containing protein [Wukongibacter sp. M2B1]|uniref:cache domain-containing protein n=1 Tax=Wukongibacter sp. M2B1 TaxID=3088895 RepID=UPI003D798B19
MNKFFNKLTVKTIIFFVIIAFLVIILYIDSSSKIFKTQYTESFHSSVVQHNISITEFLSAFESAVEMFSKNEMVQYVSDNPEKYYESTLELFKTFQQSYAPAAFAYFAPEKKIRGTKKIVSWPDTSERLSSSEWLAKERPWYIKAVESKENIVWTEPYIDATTKKYTVTVSKKVMDKEDNFKGIMAIDISLDDLSKKINYFKGPKEGYLLTILKSNGDYFFLNDNENKELKSLFTNDIIKNLYNQNSGNFHISDKIGNYYVTFTTNMITGWKVVGIIEQSSLSRGAKNIESNIFLGVVLTTFIGIASILYVTKQMGNTIQTLGGSIKAAEEKILPPDEKLKLFEFENEELIFEKVNPNINILFEIEAEKEKTNGFIKRIQDLDFSCANELKTSIEMLIQYLNNLDPSLKSNEIQKESVVNLLIETREFLNIIRSKSIANEVEGIFAELDKIIYMECICKYS